MKWRKYKYKVADSCVISAHAIAGELQLPFIKVSAPEIVSGVSGDSEKKLRELFEQAVENSPCVLFIDEIDCITQVLFLN